MVVVPDKMYSVQKSTGMIDGENLQNRLRLYLEEIGRYATVKLKLNLQGKLTFFILTAVLLVFLLIIGTVTYINRQESMEQARQISIGLSREYANEMRLYLESALGVARTLANVLEGMASNGTGDREQVYQMLRAILEKNPGFLSVWSCWEPNAFDGKDKEFAGTDWHDATGRFIPYWYRSDGGLHFEPLDNYDIQGENDYYAVPLERGKETLLEPYMEDQLGGKKELITSLVVPVKSAGKEAVGVVGIDISMDLIHPITTRLKLYETGFGRLISHTGIVASHKDPERVGDLAGEFKQQGGDALLERIRKGEIWSGEEWSTVMNSMTLKAFAPVYIGDTETPWSFGSVITKDEIMASSRRLLRITLALASAGVLLIIAAVWLISRWIVKPVRTVAEIAGRARKGDLTIVREEFGIRSQDEIGSMADALADMISSQAETVKGIRKVAETVSSTVESLAKLSEEMNSSVEHVRSNLDQASDLSESNSASIEGTTAGVEEVASSAQTMAKAAAEGSAAGEKAGKTAAAAVGKVHEAVRELGVAGEKSRASVEAITELAAAVKDIAEFVGVIASIADQTNLLALNAAIEAARAGEAGRGFAVVAEEVRKLAEDSNKAAGEVSKLIASLENNTSGAINVTEEAGAIMKETVSRAQEAEKELQGSLEEINRIIEAIASVAATSEVQAASSEEMASAMDQITQGTMKISELIRKIADASEETAKASVGVAQQAQALSARGDELLSQITRFKVQESSGDRGLLLKAAK